MPYDKLPSACFAAPSLFILPTFPLVVLDGIGKKLLTGLPYFLFSRESKNWSSKLCCDVQSIANKHYVVVKIILVRSVFGFLNVMAISLRVHNESPKLNFKQIPKSIF